MRELQEFLDIFANQIIIKRLCEVIQCEDGMYLTLHNKERLPNEIITELKPEDVGESTELGKVRVLLKVYFNIIRDINSVETRVGIKRAIAEFNNVKESKVATLYKRRYHIMLDALLNERIAVLINKLNEAFFAVCEKAEQELGKGYGGVYVL